MAMPPPPAAAAARYHLMNQASGLFFASVALFLGGGLLLGPPDTPNMAALQSPRTDLGALPSFEGAAVPESILRVRTARARCRLLSKVRVTDNNMLVAGIVYTSTAAA